MQNPLQLRLAEITEMIHAASLFHDDVIDEADTRRGVPSVNKVFGNKLAILAGKCKHLQAPRLSCSSCSSCSMSSALYRLKLSVSWRCCSHVVESCDLCVPFRIDETHEMHVPCVMVRLLLLHPPGLFCSVFFVFLRIGTGSSNVCYSRNPLVSCSNLSACMVLNA